MPLSYLSHSLLAVFSNAFHFEMFMSFRSFDPKMQCVSFYVVTAVICCLQKRICSFLSTCGAGIQSILATLAAHAR